MRKSFIKTIFILVIVFLTITGVKAAELIGVDTNTSFQSFTSCPNNIHQAAWYNQFDIGYRFTIIDEKNNNLKVADTDSVTYFHNEICGDFTEINSEYTCNESWLWHNSTSSGTTKFYVYVSNYYSHQPLDTKVNYFEGYKYSLDSTSNACSDCIKRIDLGGLQYVGPNGITNLNLMLNKVKDGEDTLFKTIMRETKVGETIFFANEYTILIEPVYLIAYQESSKMYFFAGTASEIAKFVYNDSKAYCLRHNFVPNLAKNVCISGQCNIFIANAANKTSKNNDSLKTVYETKGLGMTLIRSSDVTQQNATLTIEKRDSNNVKITGKSATFRVYADQNCTTPTTPYSYIYINDSGEGSITLPKGQTYYYKEIWPPSGYTADYTCRSIYLNSNQTVSVNNNQTCANDFIQKATNGLTFEERVELFNDWGYNNLLNFSLDTATEANEACKNITCLTDPKSGCMSGSLQTTFNSNNLACYDEIIDINGTTAFCGITLNINNNIGTSSFPSTKAGMIILGRDENNKTIANGIITKTCYTLYNGNKSIFEINSYSDYISDERLSLSKDDNNQIEKENQPITSTGPNKVTTGLNEYVITYSVKYNLISKYAKLGSGEITNNICDNCRFLGYGIYSKLIDDNLDNNYQTPNDFNNQSSIYSGKINFSYKYKGIQSENGVCTYTVEQQIIKNNELNIEFRTIQSNNAFPGKDGDGRIVGSNWCDGTDCDSSNDLIDNIMNNRNDSYNKMNSVPLYRIVLTPDTIKDIRDYNKTHSYDDYTLERDENGYYKSTFLENKQIYRTSEELQWLDDYEEILISNF